MKASILFAFSLLPFASFAGESAMWKNLDKPHRLAGRQVSDGYMRGKLALVFRWDAADDRCRMKMRFFQNTWESYKNKSFVMLAGYCGKSGSKDGVVAFLKDEGVTFPVYEGAGLAVGDPVPGESFCIYIVDETGSVRYKGKDEHRAASRLMTLLPDMEQPKTPESWKRYLDWELKVLPGRALLRLQDYRQRNPEESRKYEPDLARLEANPEVRKLAKLVDFVRKAKDCDVANRKSEEEINAMIGDGASLKASKSPLVAQEAKNAIADLKWVLADY